MKIDNFFLSTHQLVSLWYLQPSNHIQLKIPQDQKDIFLKSGIESMLWWKVSMFYLFTTNQWGRLVSNTKVGVLIDEFGLVISFYQKTIILSCYLVCRIQYIKFNFLAMKEILGNPAQANKCNCTTFSVTEKMVSINCIYGSSREYVSYIHVSIHLEFDAKFHKIKWTHLLHSACTNWYENQKV